jgi:methylthioribose-1-phosphate isomerase
MTGQAGLAGLRVVQWTGAALRLLDQRRLPEEEHWLECSDSDAVATAIHTMAVRGAPAIGIAAAWGGVLAARWAFGDRPAQAGDAAARARFESALLRLAAARPTAVNLAWALARLEAAVATAVATAGDPCVACLDAARAIEQADLADNHRMAELGADRIAPGSRILTHCNAGALATAGHGTALGVIRSAWARGHVAKVYADETRPWLQGARLTAWELLRDGIPVTLFADSAAAWAMHQGLVDWVIVGADRIAANGDVANKIGTYMLAVAARANGVRFMVVAPTSTFDPACPAGAAIPVEERAADELLALSGRRIAAPGASAWNPVFDVTPAGLVDVIVTEHGCIERPDVAGVRALLAAAARPVSTA